MKRMTIWFYEDEITSLFRIAQTELRPVKEQVRFFVREALRARGLLVTTDDARANAPNTDCREDTVAAQGVTQQRIGAR
jgi:hypothetical protein